MKKIKCLIVISIIFLISGCSAEYNVEIYNDQVKVDGKLVENDITKWDDLIFDVSYRDMVDWKTTGDDESPVADGIYKISNGNELGIGLKNNYQLLENYNTSPGIKACYQYFSVLEENKNIILSTSVQNTCFDTYKNLDSITINLKTNHKVVSSNASSVNGYHYTWNINRENKDDAAILITLKKDDYIFNYENQFIKKVIYFIIIIGIILSVGSVCYFYFRKKNMKVNEI